MKESSGIEIGSKYNPKEIEKDWYSVWEKTNTSPGCMNQERTARKATQWLSRPPMLQGHYTLVTL